MSAPARERSDGPDLRLAGFAVATWLSALSALHLSARSGVLLGVGALAVAAMTAGAVAWRRGRPPERSSLGRRFVAVRWVGMTVLLGAGCGAIATGVRVGVRDAEPLAGLVSGRQSVRVEVVVRDDPRALRGSPGLPPTYLLAVDLHVVSAEGEAALRMTARALVLGSHRDWRDLLPGQRVAATGRLMPPRGGDLRAAVVSVRGAPTLLGRPPWAQRAAGVLRTGLQRACEPLPDDAGGLLPGLVVGDTSRLDPALEEDFRTTGLTHLNAVSGTNVG